MVQLVYLRAKNRKELIWANLKISFKGIVLDCLIKDKIFWKIDEVLLKEILGINE